MRSRQIAAAALVLPLLVGVTTAEAATKKKKRPPPPPPVCHLVVDGKDDAKGTGTSMDGQNEPTLDILGADIASNATTLNVVFRMAAVEATPTTAPVGRGWDLSFTVKGQSLVVRSYVSPSATKWADGNGTGKVDAAKNEVRVMVPIAKLSTPFKPGDKITEIRASSWRYVMNDMFGKVDHGDAVKPYLAGQRSCIAVGTV
ncbi:MAG TPA: hypothetical protein VNA20_04660 [Frankiaceae bacterium]|nr:hypothetical protein [Frankiaceae bacterium]